ncbi:AAA family ATPase [Rhodococcus sp. BP-349]|uniref:AAA family ATPase n=1 Tax=unclassified Rhodococcus (in: high G+C Gram-positive bacteria) TaxID=192944 RepID=UPI001C9A5E01|nr:MULTISPECIES: AAA family ATPase [unclassified Rhodococcus (in: high G+C Gram-positive bacteria)]MBY6540420.1 AAA family ATPase [Rhodococcus sp. BP-363]MBY6545555.1 AAA family ATPase [Rhodococcus sp. BP-369]MBY6564785.1 AAA family ATPase [Rhodococcus sp. BP-370]MBY6578279.1 AAA family ATPase [Rhodococcus sp. BP-364]MBY6587580.1 AAA family ATPase [Rhodococcus sp. BP-358]
MSLPSRAVIRLIGSPRVESDAGVVDVRAFGGPRCATVFSYLAMNHGRGVVYGELAAVIWPADRPTTWSSALRSVLSRVRELLATSAALAGTTVSSRSGAVTLTLGPSVIVDLDLARRHLDPDHHSADARADRAGELLDLLGAPPLDGLHGTWADEVRIVFGRIRLRALEVDAVASLDLGRHEHALARAQELLDSDPFCEAAYRVAMRAHDALGNRARALGVAERCRTVLATELGVEMSAETQRVFVELLRGPDTGEVATTPSAEMVVVPARHVDGDRVDVDSPHDSPLLVGRTSELDVIASAVAAAAGGAGQLVVVSGDAGVGKTTVVTAALKRADSTGADVFYGRCSMDTVVPFEPFIDALGRESDRDEDDPAALAVRGMLTTGWVDTDRWSAEGPDADHRAMLSSAMERWLTGPTRRRVTVFAIDDLQWASQATLSVLRFLVHAAGRHRLCVVVTMRGAQVDGPTADLRSALPPSSVHTVSIPALTVEDVQDWTRRRGSALDPIWLHGWTSGSPIFLQAVFDAHLREPDGPSPASLADAVLWVLHRLTPTAREIVTLCAVAGVSATRVVVRAALATLDDRSFARALDELAAAGLVTEERGQDVLHLRHALIVDVVDATLSGADRAAAHSAVAAALIGSGATSTVDELARTAGHLECALDADRSAATEYLRRAGERSYAVAAYEDAAEFFRRASERCVPGGDTRARCELSIRQGRSQRRALDRGYRATLLDAAEMARRLGDLDLLLDALTADVIDGIALFQLYEPNPRRTEHLRTGLDALERVGRGASGAAAELLTQMVEESAWTSIGWSGRAADLARAAAVARGVGDHDALAHALRAVLTGLRLPRFRQQRTEALAELVQLIDVGRGHLDPSPAVIMARAHIESGDPREAAAALDAVSSTRLALDEEALWTVQCMRVGLLVATGDLRRAAEVLEDDVRRPPPAPMGRHTWGREMNAVFLLGMFRDGLGEFAAMRRDMEPLFEALPAYRAAFALSAVDTGDADGARSLVRWFENGRLAAIPVDTLWLITVVLAARAAAATASIVVCENALALLVPYADHTVVLTPGVLGVVHHHLADLCAALGRWDDAHAHVLRARAVHAARGYRMWEAESVLLAARIARSRGEPVDEVDVRAARSTARECEASALLDRLEKIPLGPVTPDRLPRQP